MTDEQSRSSVELRLGADSFYNLFLHFLDCETALDNSNASQQMPFFTNDQPCGTESRDVIEAEKHFEGN